MNRNLTSSTHLTEFAPLQADEPKSQSVSQILTKFFGFGRSCVPAEDAQPQHSVDSKSSDTKGTSVKIIDAVESSLSGLEHVGVKEESKCPERSLPNIQNRIRCLLAIKSDNLLNYEDTALKQYWMDDSVSKECYECCDKFTTFRRRHHCRVCGQIFCSQCCYQHVPGKIFGCTGSLRVCSYCCKVILQYLQTPGSLEGQSQEITDELKALQEDLSTKLNIVGVTVSDESPDRNNSTITTDSMNENISCAIRRKISVGYQEENFIARGMSNSCPTRYTTSEEKCNALKNSASFQNLFDELRHPETGIALGTHRYRLRTYTDCFLGSELVNWLMFYQKASTRVQAAAICHALLEGDYIHTLSEPYASFIDGYALYKLRVFTLPDDCAQHTSQAITSIQDDKMWMHNFSQEQHRTESDNEMVQDKSYKRHDSDSSSISYQVNVNIKDNTAHLIRPESPNVDTEEDSSYASTNAHSFSVIDAALVKTSDQREFVPESGWHHASNLREENGEKMAYKALTEAYNAHEQVLIKQLLLEKNLPLQWLDVLIRVCHETIDLIRPDQYHNAEELDIRNYVKIKKIPGGEKSETKLIRGIVFSKNVAHKGMAVSLENPKILLLTCSIVYQRTQGRFMSLEPVLLQESEYLKHTVARIAALQPNIVLVQRNVSRLAQDLLREQGIVLVQNVKKGILEQLSKCTMTDLVTSVDAHIGRPRLGTCKSFSVKTFATTSGNGMRKSTYKTLMFFEGLPQAHLGGTILVRGADRKELYHVGQVMAFEVFVVYNWRLERSFLMDEFAQPPNAQCEFSDISENTLVTCRTEDDVEEFKDINPNSMKIMKEPVADINRSNDKNTDKTVIDDFTDPLQQNEEIVQLNRVSDGMTLKEETLPFSNTFRKSLDDSIISISPFLMFSVPFLETEMGKKCKLRRYFPEHIYRCEKQQKHKTKLQYKKSHTEELENHQPVELKPSHPFTNVSIRSSVEQNDIQTLLANFRACGGRLAKKKWKLDEIEAENKSNWEEWKRQVCAESIERDVFDIHNHQRLVVLFCSFSNESNNSPAFCVNPWVICMNFYNQNDIPLGCFLERYCFRASYICPSRSCGTAMSHHIRRFVHYSGCVSITLSQFDNEYADDSIMMWTWCTKCQSVSPVVPMSSDTWSLSFAKFLELKFYGGAYSRRGESPCKHSIHQDHYQYFGYRDCVASFKYTPIEIWEISLPSHTIDITYNLNDMHQKLIDELKEVAQKGHDIFSTISDKISSLYAQGGNGEGAIDKLKQILQNHSGKFKQLLEEAQLKLTSPTVETKEYKPPKRQLAYWKISDCIIGCRKCIAEVVDVWNNLLADTIKKRDSDSKKERGVSQPDMDILMDGKGLEPLTESNSGEANRELCDSIAVAATEDSNDTNKDALGSKAQPYNTIVKSSAGSSQEDLLLMKKDNTDKKTMKNILSQLLPSTAQLALIPCPFLAQAHYNLPMGVTVPVVVYENEPSSIIAYALSSNDYQKALDDLLSKRYSANSQPQSSQTSSPMTKRKMATEANDRESPSLLGFLRNKNEFTSSTNASQNDVPLSNVQTDYSDEMKRAKAHHIEIQFQSSSCNFYCRAYFAEKFAALREMILECGEEGYIRSLCRSVQWNARGGKSGSVFSKTADDRFILKELPKTEIHLFLESALNYFTYIQKCYTTGQPSLLSKILGVYQVTFKNSTNNTSIRKNLLVIENLFYNRVVSQKFDLKGSMRNRLVIPEKQEGEIVLLDENLLKMTCESPLYILPHSKTVLIAAIQNDTEYLAEQSVMDYSLLVGLDTNKKELVLGIIDYIRTFTWDKRLETMVKRSGILGGQGKLPTIVSPQHYQKRFIEAMHRYFLEVPDHWVGLEKGIGF